MRYGLKRPLVISLCIIVAMFLSTAASAADKQYGYTLDYSAVPADVFMRKITIKVIVGTATSCSVTADSVPIYCTYTAAGSGTCTFL
jgi:hypothetical protein